ncbi:MAG: 3-oxoacyl-[acyl-carrier-protein] reductase, partial [Kiloniellales bacterium]|nr:3-oxoacyl-[acyl-carrier-protein] reductase [Kiloniellales bacterium]
VVTGASRGIGKGIALSLAAAGADLGVAARNAEALEQTAAAARELGRRVVTCAADLADAAAPDSVIETVTSELGGLDILVNNAGLTRDNLAMRMKDEEWDLVLQVNLAAGFRLMRAALRGMMKRRWGRIVSITSVVGATGNPGQANYVAAKAGLAGLSKSLAQEVASRGITVNCVAPGFIETAMTGALDEAQQQRILASIPAGRPGTPQDVASCVVFLASEESAYVTGQTLHVNGGMAMI